VADSRLGGSARAQVGVFEVDEASLPAVVAATSPRVVVVTNLFRDQLDRYGELESSAAVISAGLAALPAASQVMLCADDHRPELEQVEVPPAQPDAALAIEHRPTVLELDRNCRRGKHRARERQPERGADDVDRAVHRVPSAFSQTAGTPFRR